MDVMTMTRTLRGALVALVAFAVLGAQGAQAQAPAKPAAAKEWAPSDADKRDSESLASRWLALKDAGQGEQAYAMFSPMFREKVAFAGWSQRLKTFNALAGKVRERKLVQVTWFHDPPQAPVPGDYVALQYHGGFERIPQHLEIVVLHRPAGGGFSVLRNEVDFLPPKPAPAPKPAK